MRSAQHAGRAGRHLLEGLLEGAPHGHGLAHALHLRRQHRLCARELLEREARDLQGATTQNNSQFRALEEIGTMGFNMLCRPLLSLQVCMT